MRRVRGNCLGRVLSVLKPLSSRFVFDLVFLSFLLIGGTGEGGGSITRGSVEAGGGSGVPGDSSSLTGAPVSDTSLTTTSKRSGSGGGFGLGFAFGLAFRFRLVFGLRLIPLPTVPILLFMNL